MKKDERILFTEQQYLEQEIQYREDEYNGKTIMIIPEWILRDIKSGKIEELLNIRKQIKN